MPWLLLLACTPVQVSTGDTGRSTPDTADSLLDTEGPLQGLDTGIEAVPGVDPLDDGNSAVLFTDDVIPVFEIALSDAAIEGLLEAPYEYVEASLTHNGVTYAPVAVRTKGENSWRPFDEKSSLKFDFNRYPGGPERFLGLKGLTFNAMNEDYSMMRERVAYRMYRAAGVPAVRANHAVLYVNGELYGLFTVLDSVDDLFLARWFEDPTGSMYEQHDGDFTDDYVQDNTYFQLEEGDGDRSALQAVADALEGSGQEAVDDAGESLSWDSFLRYWAVGGVVQQFDAYPFRFAGDDCHVYHDPTTDKLHYIPHGTDESFHRHEHIEDDAEGHLAVKCMEVASCRDAWLGHVSETLDLLEKEDLAAYAEQVAEQIAALAQEDPGRKQSWADVQEYQASMISNIEGRRAEITKDLGLD